METDETFTTCYNTKIGLHRSEVGWWISYRPFFSAVMVYMVVEFLFSMRIEFMLLKLD